MHRLELVFASIALLLLGACEEAVVNDLSESSANQVILSLSDAAIVASKEKVADSWSVQVQKDDVNKALKSLNDNRVLERLSWKPKKIETSLIAGRDERHAALESAKTSRLEESIRSLPTVLEVHVHLTLAKTNSFFFDNERSKGSASVLVISVDPNSIDKNQIRALVAGATGMQVEDVSLIVERAFKKVEKPVVVPLVSSTKSKTLDSWTQVNHQQKILIAGTLAVSVVCFLVFKRRAFKDSEVSQIFDTFESLPTKNFEREKSPTPRPIRRAGGRLEGVETLEPWEVCA